MKVGDAFPSNFLKASDLEGKDVTVTIEEVTLETIDKDEKESKLLIAFKGKTKKLVCNKTNAKVIEKLYGDDTDGWIGKKITLTPREVEFQGDTVWAIRVSLKKPAEFTKPLFGKPGEKGTGAPETPADKIRKLCTDAKIDEGVLIGFLTSLDMAAEGFTLENVPPEHQATVIAQWDEFCAKIKEVTG